MEVVKGGGLAKLPEEAETVLKAVHPDWSIASWSVRFCLEKEDAIAVLSGTSTLERIEKKPQSTFDEIIEKYAEMNIAYWLFSDKASPAGWLSNRRGCFLILLSSVISQRIRLFPSALPSCP